MLPLWWDWSLDLLNVSLLLTSSAANFYHHGDEDFPFEKIIYVYKEIHLEMNEVLCLNFSNNDTKNQYKNSAIAKVKANE